MRYRYYTRLAFALGMVLLLGHSRCRDAALDPSSSKEVPSEPPVVANSVPKPLHSDTSAASPAIVGEEPQVEKILEEKPEPTVVAEQKPKPVKRRPRIRFEETSFDFGKIHDGDVVAHRFKFRNTGNAPLIIKKVNASCGCTQPSYPFIPIEAGESGYIGVRFNSTGKTGAQRPTVTVVSNAQPSIQKLHLMGVVLESQKDSIPEGESAP